MRKQKSSAKQRPAEANFDRAEVARIIGAPYTTIVNWGTGKPIRIEPIATTGVQGKRTTYGYNELFQFALAKRLFAGGRGIGTAYIQTVLDHLKGNLEYANGLPMKGRKLGTLLVGLEPNKPPVSRIVQQHDTFESVGTQITGIVENQKWNFYWVLDLDRILAELVLSLQNFLGEQGRPIPEDLRERIQSSL